jgi:hypothetical protein
MVMNNYLVFCEYRLFMTNLSRKLGSRAGGAQLAFSGLAVQYCNIDKMNQLQPHRPLASRGMPPLRFVVPFMVHQLSRRFFGTGHTMPNVEGGAHRFRIQLGTQRSPPANIVIPSCSDDLFCKSRGHGQPSPRGLLARFDGS